MSIEVLDSVRERCLNDFTFLVEHVLIPFDFGPDMKLTGWHRERCRELDDGIKSHVRKTLDLWFRQAWKSTLKSRYSTMYRYLRNPNLTTIVRHGEERKAQGIVQGMRNHHLYNPAFREIFPEYCPKPGGGLGIKESFDLPNSKNFSPEPTVRGVGIDCNLTGDHYMNVMDDDIEHRTNVNTPETRRGLIRNWEDTPSILTRKPVYEGTHDMTGTPWHANGLWAHIRNKFGPDSDAPAQKKIVYRFYPACDRNLTPFAPEILNKEDLQSVLYDEGPFKFSCNYLLIPLDEETQVFQDRWIKWREFPREKHEADKYWLDESVKMKRVLSLDIAESDRPEADCCGYVIIDIDEMDRWYIREAFKRRVGTFALIRKVQELHQKWDFDRVYVDAMATQNYFSKWLRRENSNISLSMPLIPVKKSKDNASKHQRIVACEPRVARGDFFIVDTCRNSRMLFSDLTLYPNVGHRDLLDALAQAEMQMGRGTIRKKPEPGWNTLGWWEDRQTLSVTGAGSWWSNPHRKARISAIRRRYRAGRAR